MKIRSSWKNAFYSAIIFFGTLTALSVGYSNYISSYPANVGTGSGLTSGEWNKIVSSLQILDSNLSNLSFSWGNVGIGTANPGTKLEIAWDVKISGTMSDNRPLLFLDGAGTPCNGAGTKITNWSSLLTSVNVLKRNQIGNIIWNSTTGGVTIQETGLYRLHSNFYIQNTFAPAYGTTGGRVGYTINGVSMWFWQSITTPVDYGDTHELMFSANAGDIINIISTDMPPLCFYTKHTYFTIEKIR